MRATRGGLVAATMLVGVFGRVSGAHGQSRPTLGEWDAPQECLSSLEFQSRLDAELNAERTPSGRTLLGRMRATETGYQATFTVEDYGESVGQRVLSLEGSECRAHDESLVLVAALLIENGPPEAPVGEQGGEQDAAVAPLAPDPAPEPEEPESASSQSKAAPPTIRSAQRERPFGIFGGLEFSSGRLTRLGFGVRAGLGVGLLPWLQVDALGSYLPPTSSDVAPGSVRTSAIRARVRGCAIGGDRSRWELLGCAGAGFFGVWGKGQGLPEVESAFFASPEIVLDVGVHYRLTSWLLVVLEGDLGFGLRQGRMVFAPRDPSDPELVVHRTSTVLPGAFWGILARF